MTNKERWRNIRSELSVAIPELGILKARTEAYFEAGLREKLREEELNGEFWASVKGCLFAGLKRNEENLINSLKIIEENVPEQTLEEIQEDLQMLVEEEE